MCRTFQISERRACRALEQPRSTQRYEPAADADERRLVRRMLQLVRQRPRFGDRRIATLLQREGWVVNVKRVHRLWKREGLKVPQKPRKKRAIDGVKRRCIAPCTWIRCGPGTSSSIARRREEVSSG